jgi:hypothetical protein
VENVIERLNVNETVHENDPWSLKVPYYES